MKAALVFFLLVALATVSVQGFYNESRIIGNVRPGDRLLNREAAFKPGKMNQVVVYNYMYPKSGAGGFISCIKVIDKFLNGYNGDLYINSGGVNSRSVSMSLRSKKGYGINYDIEVWGR